MSDSLAAPDFQWQLQASYLSLPEIFYSRQDPVAVREPRLVIFNHKLARDLGLGDIGDRSDTVTILAGNEVPSGMTPFSQAYAGHQFGGFSILGDGRAVVLGEWITPDGARVDLQLKGSGPTPYSRRGDGRAALGPMLREYLISEAMHALGIPTTRSLAVVATGEPVFRNTALPGAVLTRVASSHLRVGTFQYAAARGDVALLERLVTYAIDRHYPALADSSNLALALLDQVVRMQASLLVNWMRVGFIHGVMNTDNMTISGETIDYGPCAFMDAYDPATVFSSIDHQGRYAFGNQPGIAQWNLLRLAESLLPLLDPNEDQAIEIAKQAVGQFATVYTEGYEAMMRRKLGLLDEDPAKDNELVNDLLELMVAHKMDFTNTFRDLMEPVLPAWDVQQIAAFAPWRDRWLDRLESQAGGRLAAVARMAQVNPTYIPRNHLVEQALSAAEQDNDLGPFHELLEVLADPYHLQVGREAYALASAPDPGYQTFCGT